MVCTILSAEEIPGSMKRSILSSLSKDFCLFYLPSLLTAILFLLAVPGLAPSQSYASAAILFISFYIIDGGHTFLSALRVFRTWNDESVLYLFLIFSIFFASLLCVLWKPIWLFRIYLYSTVFHHVRQHWGLTAWYQKLNKRFDPMSYYFIHAFLFLPFFALHFDPASKSAGFFQEDELLLFPSLILFKICIGILIVLLAIFLFHEIENSKKYGIEWNRIMSILCPAIVQFLVFFFCGKSIFALIPLVIGHGFSYSVLLGSSLKKLSPKRSRISLNVLIVCLALVGGSLLFLADTLLESVEEKTLLSQSLLAFLTLPAIWHYVVDAFIWKGKHPEAAVIYSQIGA